MAHQSSLLIRSGRRTRQLAPVAVCALSLAALSACGDDSTDTAAPTEQASIEQAPITPTPVQLADHKIAVADTLDAGNVTFDVMNTAAGTTHELVVIRTDLAGGALPVDASGVVDEQGAGIEFVDEREDIEPGQRVQLPVTLGPGKYVLVCNLANHYALGMWKAVTVTGDAPVTTIAVTVTDAERTTAISGLATMTPMIDALVADVLDAPASDAARLTSAYEAINDVWFGFEETIRHDDVTLYLDMEDELQALKRAVDGRDATKAASASAAFDQLAERYASR